MAQDAGSLLASELHVQRKFLHGLLFIGIAICMRWQKLILPQDSLAMSKVAFSLFLPSLLFAKVWKAPLPSSLWHVALVSFFVHMLLVCLVVLVSRFIPQISKEKGFRGQLMISLMGSNIASVYPFVLANEDLQNQVFSALVVWDMAGNSIIILLVNKLVAARCAPPDIQEEESSQMMSSSQTSSTGPPAQVLGASEASQEARSRACSSIGNSQSAEEEGVQPEIEVETEPPEPKISMGSVDGESLSARHGARRSTTLIISNLVLASTGSLDLSCLHKGGSLMKSCLSKTLSNVPLVAQVAALAINISGARLPEQVDEFVEILGQPYTVLFFLLIGLNLSWKVIRPRLRIVLLVLFYRLLLAGLLGTFVWLTPGVLPSVEARQAAVFGLVSPMSGLSMGYAIMYGYDRGLQAALNTASSLVSFAALCCLIIVTS
eukprot:TRINITY_DN13012_c0_g1_i1.p1 TRINITY_DN13012_c0_g1~~TRINITY_DN13012_c0_g1_i1.p1  ORF type:complete len:434 (+),score=89.91 TRINITY_DN13012_c0_g1_i1:90-1391(+)